MERKNDNTILLLVAAGLGIYWLTRKKTAPVENISTQPVIEQPILVTPVLDEPIYTAPVFKENVMEQPVQNIDYTPVTDMFSTISTQPVYEQPIYTAPIIEQPIYADIISTQPVYEQPIYTAPVIEQPVQNVEFTPITDMFNTVWQPDYVDKTVIDPVFNMNIEAL